MKQRIVICNIYLPTSKTFSVHDLMSIYQQLPRPCLILGDFNAHNQLWGCNSTSRSGQLFEEFLDHTDMSLLNDGSPTRINMYNGRTSAIDLTVCDPQIMANFTWQPLSYPHGSDHFPIRIENSLELEAGTNNASKPIWNTAHARWDKFAEEIDEYLPSLQINTDINDTVKHFNSVILEAAHKHVGKQTPGTTHRTVPWWNVECEQAIKDNKRAFNTWKRHPSQENLQRYKKLRAKARFITKQSKKTSWAKFVSEITPNTPPRLVWNKINKIKGTKRNQKTHLLEIGDKLISQEKEVIEVFANKFEKSSQDSNYAQDFLDKKQQVESTPIALLEKPNSLINAFFTMAELSEALTCSRNSAPGPDDIPLVFLQHLPPAGKSHLLVIYNSIWTEHIFPKIWRHAIVIPLLKPTKPAKDVDSYRPISLTSTMCKIMEKMINRRLTWDLERKECISSFQSGFRRMRSTNDNIINLESYITESFLSKNKVIAIFFDIEKAYDMTWRHKIISQLTKWGYGGHIAFYIQNFLQDRSFEVRTNTMSSTTRCLQNGIPQGSVLSVTLFLIGINDIIEKIGRPVQASLFADDLVIYLKGKDVESTRALLQQALTTLEEWSESNGLRFSLEKTKCVLFTQHKEVATPRLTLFGKDLDFTDQVKFLGVTFDKRLTWKPHIATLKTSSIRLLNLLKVLAHHTWGADTQSLLLVYRALIRSRLEYGAAAFSSCQPSRLKPLCVIQNTALRIAVGAFRTTPVDSLHCLTQELPLTQRFTYLRLAYAANTLRNPPNPNTQLLLKRRSCPKPNLRSIHLLPVGERLAQDLHFLNMSNMPPLLQVNHSKTPPWITPPWSTDFSMTKFRKNEVPHIQIVKEFQALCAKYPTHSFHYTDASKSIDGVGAAIASTAESAQFSLPPHCSTFTGELFALLKALEHALTLGEKQVAVCSDSLSALQSVNSLYSTNPLVQQAHEAHHKLLQRGKQVELIFVPSHVGITGNDTADYLARTAPSADTATQIAWSVHSDVKNLFKVRLRTHWQSSWTLKPSLLKQVKPKTCTWLPLPPQRKHQVAISRLRLGHTRLTHQHLLTPNKDPALCPACDVPLTVQHIIGSCPSLQQHRDNNNLDADLRLTLGGGQPLDVIKFLSESALLYLI